MQSDFQVAVERARSRVGEDFWDDMSLNLQSRAIYEELHALDAERVVGTLENSEERQS
jgi:hypothetical protein